MQTKEILSIQSAVQVGEEIMKIYNKDFSVEYKDDKSPIKLIGGWLFEIKNIFLPK